MLIFCGARVTADQVGYELRGHPAPESPSAESGRGAPACFLSGISGWFSLSLGAWVPKNLARRRMQLWLMASAAPSPISFLGFAVRGGGRDARVSFATTRSQQLAEGARLPTLLTSRARARFF
jgi:hypothetical protein